MNTWQPIARVSMDRYDDMGAVGDALSSAIERRFGGATMTEGGSSSLLILFKGSTSAEVVRDWAKQWLEDHPRESSSGKSSARIEREIRAALAGGAGVSPHRFRKARWNLYDAAGRLVGDVFADSAEEALRSGGLGVASARRPGPGGR